MSARQSFCSFVNPKWGAGTRSQKRWVESASSKGVVTPRARAILEPLPGAEEAAPRPSAWLPTCYLLVFRPGWEEFESGPVGNR